MRLLLALLLPAAAFSQTPSDVIGALDEGSMPELKAFISWQPVANATYYNIYREFNPNGLDGSCPVTYGAPLDNTTTTYYDDDPAPDLWQLSVTENWRSKIWWCYKVSAVVDGVEGPLSDPVAIAVADAFYITLRYQTACVNGKVVEPFPYLNGQVDAHFYYTDADGLDHEFPVEQLYNSFGQPQPYNEEWEGRLPIVANDGTIVPWIEDGKYRAVIKTPDGGNYTKQITAPYNSDAGYYSQRLIYRVLGGPDCPASYSLGSEYDWWQNVLK